MLHGPDHPDIPFCWSIFRFPKPLKQGRGGKKKSTKHTQHSRWSLITTEQKIITILHLPDTLFPTQPCHTVSFTQMDLCCWLKLSTASTSTPVTFQQDSYSHSHCPTGTNAWGYSTSGIWLCILPSFQRTLLVQFSHFSRLLCTEALPFSAWITFSNLELSPDFLRTWLMSWMAFKEYSKQCGLWYFPRCWQPCTIC